MTNAERNQVVDISTDLCESGFSTDLRARFRLLITKFWKQRIGIYGAIIVFFMSSVAITAPCIAPHSPFKQNVTKKLLPPFWEKENDPSHLLGTDVLGRDVLSRLMHGARVSMLVGFLAVALSSSVGVLLGLLAGFYGKWIDSVISNAVNIMLGFPFILLALAAISIVGPSFKTIVIILGITGWPLYTRLIRVETLTIRELDYIEAARSVGCGNIRVIFRHILPNTVNSIIVVATLEMARMIILESFLSFLGAGIQPPIPSWGGMLGEGRLYIYTHDWYVTLPGLAIFITTLGINMLGDGLRGLLDPYARIKL